MIIPRNYKCYKNLEKFKRWGQRKVCPPAGWDILTGVNRKMKWKLKIALCGVLMVFAGLSLWTVLEDLGVLKASAAGEETYVLRSHQGYVSVFTPGSAAEPSLLTDIWVDDLPAGDRRELERGIGVEDYEEMIAMLEGLSS